MKFIDLGLSDETLKAIDEMGYTEPTPIQAQAIPAILMTKDIIGLAQTGTGKTASFTLPMIEVLASGRARMRMPRSLVLAPTRELAAQVAENFEQYGKYHNLSMALLVGGTSMGAQIKKLEKGVDVLIATPGRLLYFFYRGQKLLSDNKILVIDEADRMLDMGFIPDIESIMKKLPAMRQTLLFSATMPDEVKRLSETFLSNPKQISVAPAATTATNVTQKLFMLGHWKDKEKKMISLLEENKVETAFIFCNRKKDVDTLERALKRKGHNVAGLHGDMAQPVRTSTLERFKAGEITILVCSDVAGRGIDVKNISHVFNYDVPMHADDYVHRIGRTGRAGASGEAWTLATSADDKYLDAIYKKIGNKIPLDAQATPKAKTDDKKAVPEKSSSKPQKKVQSKPHGQEKPKATPKQSPVKESQDNVVGFGDGDDEVPAFLRG
jgi:superfamily II DNA/RNA helicase